MYLLTTLPVKRFDTWEENLACVQTPPQNFFFSKKRVSEVVYGKDTGPRS